MSNSNTEPAPDEVEYECPVCGLTDTVHRSAKWKTIRCRDGGCDTVILNADIGRL